MTILVGILCKDGVVVGADSSATFGVGPQIRTIEQPTHKIDIVRGEMIVAHTGAVGLGQRFQYIAEQLWQKNQTRKEDALTIAKQLCAAAVQDFGSTQAPKGAYGALVAFPAKSQFELVEFPSNDLQPERKESDKIWYVSMGRGQPIGDCFLGFLRRTCWRDGCPSLAEGRLAVTWVLDQAVDLNPGGINAPLRMAELTKNESGVFSARFVPDEELEEHRNHLSMAEGAFQQAICMTGTESTEIPTNTA